MISFFIPGRPFSKQRPRFAKGRAYTHPETAAAEKAIAWYAQRAIGASAPLAGPVSLVYECIFVLPEKPKKGASSDWHIYRPDLDNMEKLLDALNGLAWKDDSQVCAKISLKRYAEIDEEEGVHVHVAPLVGGSLEWRMKVGML
jgi:Holliday junction resolvase RusA-like endonuclease